MTDLGSGGVSDAREPTACRLTPLVCRGATLPTPALLPLEALGRRARLSSSSSLPARLNLANRTIRCHFQHYGFRNQQPFSLSRAKKACRDSPRQDSPFPTPRHALPNLGPIL